MLTNVGEMVSATSLSPFFIPVSSLFYFIFLVPSLLQNLAKIHPAPKRAEVALEKHAGTPSINLSCSEEKSKCRPASEAVSHGDQRGQIAE